MMGVKYTSKTGSEVLMAAIYPPWQVWESQKEPW